MSIHNAFQFQLTSHLTIRYTIASMTGIEVSARRILQLCIKTRSVTSTVECPITNAFGFQLTNHHDRIHHQHHDWHIKCQCSPGSLQLPSVRSTAGDGGNSVQYTDLSVLLYLTIEYTINIRVFWRIKGVGVSITSTLHQKHDLATGDGGVILPTLSSEMGRISAAPPATSINCSLSSERQRGLNTSYRHLSFVSLLLRGIDSSSTSIRCHRQPRSPYLLRLRQQHLCWI